MHQQLAYNDVHHHDHDLRSGPRFLADVSSRPSHVRLAASKGQTHAPVDGHEPASTRPSSKPRSDRCVNSGRVISRRRDAAHALDYQTFAQGRLSARHGVGVVYKGKTFSSSFHPEAENDNEKAADDLLEDLLTDGDASAAPTSVSSFPHWSTRWIGHPTTHRTCAAERDLSANMRLDAAFYAALEAGQVYAFTLHLNDANEAKARAVDDAADWIYRRICLRLGKIQKLMLFAMAVEDRTSDKKRSLAFDLERDFDRKKKALAKLFMRDDRRVHVHGFIVIADHEMKDVKKALKLAGGVGFGRGRQLMVKPVYSVGWASYMMKHAHLSNPKFLPRIAGTSWAPRFKGEPMKMSGPLRSLAKAHYEAFRAHQKARVAGTPRASRPTRKPRFRWPTDVRAMLGSTTLTPLSPPASVLEALAAHLDRAAARPSAAPRCARRAAARHGRRVVSRPRSVARRSDPVAGARRAEPPVLLAA
ncbi:hypothetical protein [Methylopila turkensis]|uniref:Uncharacterized protein n=1 Tax=Methylopila turkensis TaxID=1437816 RepID=A0A9W6N694_9HYPH|nr:hypothetical protein [Methylopila turkensis]GLK79091.1 hypothetical protein GCM10008174_08320 [Methylopila turkensis]